MQMRGIEPSGLNDPELVTFTRFERTSVRDYEKTSRHRELIS